MCLISEYNYNYSRNIRAHRFYLIFDLRNRIFTFNSTKQKYVLIADELLKNMISLVMYGAK